MLPIEPLSNDDEANERGDLEMSVFSQMVNDIIDQDLEPLADWIKHLSDECLLYFLPKTHFMFKGLREDSVPDWYKTVPYVVADEYIGDVIGRN